MKFRVDGGPCRQRRWIDYLSDEDLGFLKRFLLASGTLKDLAAQYGILYPMGAATARSTDPEGEGRRGGLDRRPFRSRTAVDPCRPAEWMPRRSGCCSTPIESRRKLVRTVLLSGLMLLAMALPAAPALAGSTIDWTVTAPSRRGHRRRAPHRRAGSHHLVNVVDPAHRRASTSLSWDPCASRQSVVSPPRAARGYSAGGDALLLAGPRHGWGPGGAVGRRGWVDRSNPPVSDQRSRAPGTAEVNLVLPEGGTVWIRTARSHRGSGRRPTGWTVRQSARSAATGGILAGPSGADLGVLAGR